MGAAESSQMGEGIITVQGRTETDGVDPIMMHLRDLQQVALVCFKSYAVCPLSLCPTLSCLDFVLFSPQVFFSHAFCSLFQYLGKQEYPILCGETCLLYHGVRWT